MTQQGSFEIVPGDLCFVRPEDIHFFKSNKCEMFNILISDELWNQAAAFIGPSPVLRDLTGAEAPIKINLHQEDFEFTRHMLETNILVPYNNKDDYNAQLKLVLITMLKLFSLILCRKRSSSRRGWTICSSRCRILRGTLRGSRLCTASPAIRRSTCAARSSAI